MERARDFSIENSGLVAPAEFSQQRIERGERFIIASRYTGPSEHRSPLRFISLVKDDLSGVGQLQSIKQNVDSHGTNPLR